MININKKTIEGKEALELSVKQEKIKDNLIVKLITGVGYIGLIITFIILVSLILFFKAPPQLIIFASVFFLFMILYIFVAKNSVNQKSGQIVNIIIQKNKLIFKNKYPFLFKIKDIEFSIDLTEDSKLVLVKAVPVPSMYYMLMIYHDKKFDLIMPRQWDVLGRFPMGPRTSFVFNPEEAKELAELLNLPIEISNTNYYYYLKEYLNKNEV